LVLAVALLTGSKHVRLMKIRSLTGREGALSTGGFDPIKKQFSGERAQTGVQQQRPFVRQKSCVVVRAKDIR